MSGRLHGLRGLGQHLLNQLVVLREGPVRRSPLNNRRHGTDLRRQRQDARSSARFQRKHREQPWDDLLVLRMHDHFIHPLKIVINCF